MVIMYRSLEVLLKIKNKEYYEKFIKGKKQKKAYTVKGKLK